MTDTAPFLILTRRRTGGTSLAAFLSRISPLPTAQHEPFNNGRVWHGVSARFAAHGDTEQLRQDIRALIAKSQNIKHCFDVGPRGLATVLTDICAEAGYRIILLTRANEVDRQMSLAIAQATGAWGARQAATLYPPILAGETVLPPLPVKRVLDQARRDGLALMDILSHLRVRHIAHDWLIFEEIYSSTADLRRTALQLAQTLGLTLEDSDPRLDALAGRGGQNSARIEDFLPNAAETRSALQAICG